MKSQFENKMTKVASKILIWIIICSCYTFCTIQSEKLLAMQRFGVGYPSFHIIKINDNGKKYCKDKNNLHEYKKI